MTYVRRYVFHVENMNSVCWVPLADPEVSDTGAEPAGAFQTTIRPEPSLLFALAVAPDFGVNRLLYRSQEDQMKVAIIESPVKFTW